jgi:transcription elongation factor GreA
MRKEFLAKIKLLEGEIVKLGRLIDNQRRESSSDEVGFEQELMDRQRIYQIEIERIKAILRQRATISFPKQQTIKYNIECNKYVRQVEVVPSHMSDPIAGRISEESPLGRALLGGAEGEKVEIETPVGLQIYKIREVVAE